MIHDHLTFDMKRGEAGLFYVTCRELPGILVANETLAGAFEEIVPAMAVLQEVEDFLETKPAPKALRRGRLEGRSGADCESCPTRGQSGWV